MYILNRRGDFKKLSIDNQSPSTGGFAGTFNQWQVGRRGDRARAPLFEHTYDFFPSSEINGAKVHDDLALLSSNPT